MPHLATINRTATIYTSQNLTALPVSANVARKHCLGTFPSNRVVAKNNTEYSWKHYYRITKRAALSFHHQHAGSHLTSFRSKRRSVDEKTVKRGSGISDVLHSALNKYPPFLPLFDSQTDEVSEEVVQLEHLLYSVSDDLYAWIRAKK